MTIEAYFEQFVGDTEADMAAPVVKQPRKVAPFSIAPDSPLARAMRYSVSVARLYGGGDEFYLYQMTDPDRKSLATLVKRGYLESGLDSWIERWYRITAKGRALAESIG